MVVPIKGHASAGPVITPGVAGIDLEIANVLDGTYSAS